MSLTQRLSLFLDVVQQGSFSRAATLHDMDNSALSRQIKKLESELGVQLLNRSTRSFSLTPAGEEILERAQSLVDTLNDIRNIADTYQSEPKGLLRITASIFFGQQYLQPVISQFMQRYPEVRINLLLDDRRSDIIADHIDLAFRIGKLSTSNLIARKIAHTHFALVASQEFVARHGEPETPEQLVAMPAVIYSNGNVSLDLLRISTQPHGAEMQNLKMQGNYRISDVRTMMTAVQDGLGYCMLDLFNLERPVSEMGLTPLLTQYRLSTQDTGIYAIYPHRQQSLLAREFVHAVQAYIGSPPFWLKHMPGYEHFYQ